MIPSIIRFLMSLLCNICGFGLLWAYYDWTLALGVFLCLWGNNILIMYNVHKEQDYEVYRFLHQRNSGFKG
jgi:hypothetical protein